MPCRPGRPKQNVICRHNQDVTCRRQPQLTCWTMSWHCIGRSSAPDCSLAQVPCASGRSRQRQEGKMFTVHCGCVWSVARSVVRAGQKTWCSKSNTSRTGLYLYTGRGDCQVDSQNTAGYNTRQISARPAKYTPMKVARAPTVLARSSVLQMLEAMSEAIPRGDT